MSQPSPLAAAQRAAAAHRDTGDLAGARSLLEAALETARPSLGEDHPEMLTVAHQLAMLHRQAGEATAARRVLEQALAAGQRRYGDADPLLIAISFDLGGVAGELGNRHEARRNFGRVAAAGPAVLGQDHWMVRAARGYLGRETATGPPTGSPPAAIPQLPTAPPAAAHQRPITTTIRRPRGRGPMIGAALAAVAALVVASLAAVAVFRDDPAAPGPAPRVGTTTAGAALGPPTEVEVREQGSSIVVTWADPAPGRAQFVVMGRRDTEPSFRQFGQVPAGEKPRLRLHGLDPTAGYCFVVLAAHQGANPVPSRSVCLLRTPTPGP